MHFVLRYKLSYIIIKKIKPNRESWPKIGPIHGSVVSTSLVGNRRSNFKHHLTRNRNGYAKLRTSPSFLSAFNQNRRGDFTLLSINCYLNLPFSFIPYSIIGSPKNKAFPLFLFAISNSTQWGYRNLIFTRPFLIHGVWRSMARSSSSDWRFHTAAATAANT